eukprot:Protomagalhaensia_wolfi_Nauph_80__5595@NODE_630_length_2184_cov_28_724476_g471_i0_p1_GENE_NODE_630_length_2184_cov_28_724476_g471_i0NODE_630_length_2184_cov_28_724476_g471_i0_p1_ORF_typecomplete_len662_score137_28PG_binding_1/PF01471_18/0_64PG_binding_1/PF01471_18/3_9e03_NODE_630_length_2184_cov_28_724476_g471_i01432128
MHIVNSNPEQDPRASEDNTKTGVLIFSEVVESIVTLGNYTFHVGNEEETSGAGDYYVLAKECSNSGCASMAQLVHTELGKIKKLFGYKATDKPDFYQGVEKSASALVFQMAEIEFRATVRELLQGGLDSVKTNVDKRIDTLKNKQELIDIEKEPHQAGTKKSKTEESCKEMRKLLAQRLLRAEKVQKACELVGNAKPDLSHTAIQEMSTRLVEELSSDRGKRRLIPAAAEENLVAHWTHLLKEVLSSGDREKELNELEPNMPSIFRENLVTIKHSQDLMTTLKLHLALMIAYKVALDYVSSKDESAFSVWLQGWIESVALEMFKLVVAQKMDSSKILEMKHVEALQELMVICAPTGDDKNRRASYVTKIIQACSQEERGQTGDCYLLDYISRGFKKDLPGLANDELHDYLAGHPLETHGTEWIEAGEWNQIVRKVCNYQKDFAKLARGAFIPLLFKQNQDDEGLTLKKKAFTRYYVIQRLLSRLHDGALNSGADGNANAIGQAAFDLIDGIFDKGTEAAVNEFLEDKDATKQFAFALVAHILVTPPASIPFNEFKAHYETSYEIQNAKKKDPEFKVKFPTGLQGIPRCDKFLEESDVKFLTQKLTDFKFELEVRNKYAEQEQLRVLCSPANVGPDDYKKAIQWYIQGQFINLLSEKKQAGK